MAPPPLLARPTSKKNEDAKPNKSSPAYQRFVQRRVDRWKQLFTDNPEAYDRALVDADSNSAFDWVAPDLPQWMHDGVKGAGWGLSHGTTDDMERAERKKNGLDPTSTNHMRAAARNPVAFGAGAVVFGAGSGLLWRGGIAKVAKDTGRHELEMIARLGAKSNREFATRAEMVHGGLAGYGGGGLSEDEPAVSGERVARTVAGAAIGRALAPGASQMVQAVDNMPTVLGRPRMSAKDMRYLATDPETAILNARRQDEANARYANPNDVQVQRDVAPPMESQGPTVQALIDDAFRALPPEKRAAYEAQRQAQLAAAEDRRTVIARDLIEGGEPSARANLPLSEYSRGLPGGRRANPFDPAAARARRTALNADPNANAELTYNVASLMEAILNKDARAVGQWQAAINQLVIDDFRMVQGLRQATARVLAADPSLASHPEVVPFLRRLQMGNQNAGNAPLVGSAQRSAAKLAPDPPPDPMYARMRDADTRRSYQPPLNSTDAESVLMAANVMRPDRPYTGPTNSMRITRTEKERGPRNVNYWDPKTEIPQPIVVGAGGLSGPISMGVERYVTGPAFGAMFPHDSETIPQKNALAMRAQLAPQPPAPALPPSAQQQPANGLRPISGQVVDRAPPTRNVTPREPVMPPRSNQMPPTQARSLQQTLNAIGFNSGPNDGVVGPITAAAAARFAQRSGMPNAPDATTIQRDPQLQQLIAARMQAIIARPGGADYLLTLVQE